MVLPNYKDGSIVNLISTVVRARGGRSQYGPLKILKPAEIKDTKNIVLLILDGFGMDLLKRHASDSIFSEHLRGQMTSVFPSTTTAAMSTYYFGVPAQQHGLTSWFMNLKEFGSVISILPGYPRFGREKLDDLGVDVRKFINQKSILDRIKTSSYFIQPKKISDSAFSKIAQGQAKSFAYRSLPGLFRSIKKAIKSSNKKKLVFAYWDGVDHLSHKFGPKHKIVERHIGMVEKQLVTFLKSIEGTDTTVLISADHGHIQVSKNIYLNKYPDIMDCLTVPMCGEPRAAFVYVRPSKLKQFMKAYNKHLKKYCTLMKSEHLIKKQYFGLGKPHKHLFDRIGDFILFPKKDYVLSYYLFHEQPGFMKGNHGGLSKEEMLVPLIVIKK